MKEKEKGWVSLYRQFTEWEWYDDANTMRLFIHCLLLANFEDKKWRGKLIKRGSFITSQPKLAHSLKLSIKQIRGSLTKLKTTGEVAVQTTPDYSIITVKNYNLYQDEGRLKDRQKSHEGQSKGRLRATTNNDNKRDINKLISLSCKERDLLKKYLSSKPKREPIQDWDAYIASMIKNGTIESKLEKAKQWQERQEQKKLKVVTPPIEQEQSTPEDEQRGIELLRDTVKKIKKGA